MQLVPSQLILVLSVTMYYLIYDSIAHFLAWPARLHQLHQSRELLSALHSTLVTVLSLAALHQYSLGIYPNSRQPSSLSDRGEAAAAAVTYATDSDLPLIQMRSEVLNSLTALETGYLIVDVLALCGIQFYRSPCPGQQRQKHEADAGSTNRIRHTDATSRESKPIKGSANATILLIHHILLLIGLLTLHFFYVPRSRDRGVLVVVMLLLLNASNPVGSLRWWIINFRTGRGNHDTTEEKEKKKSTVTNLTVSLLDHVYLSLYALVRVYGPYWLLTVWAGQLALLPSPSSSSSSSSSSSPSSSSTVLSPPEAGPGPPSAWTALFALRPWCQLGTVTIWAGNTAWLLFGLWRLGGREAGRWRGQTRQRTV